jgi:two-component system, LytTR family, sensor kinase
MTHIAARGTGGALGDQTAAHDRRDGRPPSAPGPGLEATMSSAQAPPASGAARRRLRKAAVVIGIWTLVGLFGTQQWYLALALAGQPAPWLQLLGLSLSSVWIWAAFTPAMLLASRRWRLDRHAWRVSVPAHVALAFGLAFLDVVLDHVLAPWISPFPRQPLLGMFVRQLDVNLFSYVAVVAIDHAAGYYALYRERQLAAAHLASQLATAHLHALRAQLQPHFLFNTLNAVAELVYEDPEAADRMVTRLAALLRRSIATLGQHEVPLRAELDFLETYLDVVRLRFGARVAITVDAPPDVLDALVPTFLLQPLVENALRHGVEPLPEGGRVEVVARRHSGPGDAVGADTVEIEVRDTGRGLPGGAPPSEGVGLRNTRDRLRQLYGDAHRFTVRDRPGGGTVATVSVPWRPAESAA